MWPVLFRKSSSQSDVDVRQPTRLNCILHFLARRDEADEGFILTTNCLSTCQFEYRTRSALQAGELLRIKIVSGSYSIDVRGRVLTVAGDASEPAPMMEFVELTDLDKRVISNLIRRYRISE